MRRETKTSKGKNRLSVEANVLEHTLPVENGEIVEELKVEYVSPATKAKASKDLSFKAKATEHVSPLDEAREESRQLLDTQLELEKAMKKIKSLEAEKKKTSSVEEDEFSDIRSLSIRNNIKKLLFAVKEESRKQSCEWPNISTNKLRKHYKVTADSFKHCIAYGIEKKLIERREVSYSGNVKTWCYRLL